MQRKDRDLLDKAVDDVVTFAMAYCNAIRERNDGRIYRLWRGLMNATRRLEQRKRRNKYGT